MSESRTAYSFCDHWGAVIGSSNVKPLADPYVHAIGVWRTALLLFPKEISVVVVLVYRTRGELQRHHRRTTQLQVSCHG